MVNYKKLRFSDDNGKEYPEWEEKTLGEVSEVTMGQSPPSENYTNDSKYHVLIQGNADMKQGKIIPRVYSKNGNKRALPGEIILSVRAPVGPVAKTSIEAFIGRGVCAIKGTDYIFNFLKYFYETNKWDALAQGSTFTAVNSAEIKALKIPVPSLPEQEKIAEFLSALDDRITLQESKIELLTQQKKGYAQRIFSRELRFRDDNGNKYPEWEEKPLGQVVEIVMGQSPLSENYTDDNKHTVLIQGNADMKQGKIVPRVYSKDGSKKANPGDIILSVRAPVGPVSKTDIEAFIGRGVCSIKGSDYIFNFLKYFYEIKGWDSLAQGSTFTAVNSAQVKNLIIPLPSSAEQGKIANFLSTLDDQIILEKEKLTQLKLQKQGYMQRIFG